MKKRGIVGLGSMRRYLPLVCMGFMLMVFTSCGTILGGRVQTCQKIKPTFNKREIRPWALAGDILLAPIALPVDFFTGAIYKPCINYSSMAINRKEVRRFYNR
jgi:hypothetical protein